MAYFRCTGNSGGSLKLRTAQGEIASFETNLPEPYQSVTVNVVATGGNGTPDNPNPINGYTEANITRCGVNLWGHNDVTIESASYVIDNEDVYLPAGTYVIQWKFSGTTGAKSGRIDDADGNAITTFSGAVSDGLNSEIITIPTGKTGVKFKLYSVAIGTYSDFEISIGSVTPDYHPYTGNTYTIAFGQTVYGGVLDVMRGKLHVTWKGSDMGDLSYAYEPPSTGTYGRMVTSDLNTLIVKSEGSLTPICEKYRAYSNLSAVMNSTDGFWESAAGNISFTSAGYTDANTFKTAMSDTKFIYPLATPFDIDLTPVQIRALMENNVFADCGETEVEYLKVE